MWGWTGALTAMVGATLLAINSEYYTKYGFVFMLTSNIAWIIHATKNKDKALAILNVFFVPINLFGIYKWFF